MAFIAAVLDINVYASPPYLIIIPRDGLL